MSKRFMADGNTGRVAIMEGGSRDVFENPLDNLAKVHFHSDLDYLTIVQSLELPFFGMSAIPGVYKRVTIKGKKSKDDSKTYVYPQHSGGTKMYNIGQLIGDVDGPILAFIGNKPAGSMPIHQVVGQNGEMSFRSISIVKRGNQIWLSENWSSVGYTVPAQTISIKLVKFNLMSDSNPNSPYKLMITPERFIASGGKMDSRARYAKKTPSGATPDFYMNVGRTMDTANGGSRWWSHDGTYLDENGYKGDFVQPLKSTGITL